MNNGREGLDPVVYVAEKMFRCMACSRLIPETEEDRCPICGADNTHWRKLTEFDHFRRFPLVVWIAIGGVLVTTLLLPAIAYCAGLSPESSQALLIAAILGLILSIALVVAIYVFKFTLRNYELVRRVRKEELLPGLVTSAVLLLGVATALSLAVLHLWSAPAVALVYGGFVPILNLALMLVGVRYFTEHLDKEFPGPIYLHTDDLVRVALKSIRAQLQMQTDEEGPGMAHSPLPIHMDAERLSKATSVVAKSVRELLRIPANKKLELLVLSLTGRPGGGLSFTFGRGDKQRYRVESDLNNQIMSFEGSPRLEELHVISIGRTASGGLSLVVSRRVESEKKDEKTGEIMHVFEEKCHYIEADKWGYIHSLEELAPGKK